MSDSAIVTFALIAAVAGIAYGLYLAMWVFKLNAGNAKMQEIAKAIQWGSTAGWATGGAGAECPTTSAPAARSTRSTGPTVIAANPCAKSLLSAVYNE